MRYEGAVHVRSLQGKTVGKNTLKRNLDLVNTYSKLQTLPPSIQTMSKLAMVLDKNLRIYLPLGVEAWGEYGVTPSVVEDSWLSVSSQHVWQAA